MKSYIGILLLLMPVFTFAQIIVPFAGGGSVMMEGVPATSVAVGGTGGGAFDKFGNYY